MIVSTSGRKPRSSISSASSSTSRRTPERSRLRWRRWSSRRPGVPTTTWAPSLRATIWGPSGRPPTTETTRTPVSLPAASRSPATCRHSSRVGTTTRAWTFGSSWSMPWTIGTPKARVLPVPVRAWPIRSTPASASGRQSVWIGKGCSMPILASEVSVVGATPRSAKLRSGTVVGEVVAVRLNEPPVLGMVLRGAARSGERAGRHHQPLTVADPAPRVPRPGRSASAVSGAVGSDPSRRPPGRRPGISGAVWGVRGALVAKR